MTAIVSFAVWIMGMCFLTSKVEELLKANGCSERCETWTLFLLWIVSFVILASFSNNLQREAEARGFYEAMESKEEWDVD